MKRKFLFLAAILLLFPANAFAGAAPVFYESFDSLALIQANNGHCGAVAGSPLCSPDHNIAFVPGFINNGVQFGGGQPFITRIYYNFYYKDTNEMNKGTLEFWVKPIEGYGYIYNSDLYWSGMKIGSEKSITGVIFLWQRNGDHIFRVPENSRGWHKAVLTWHCDNNGEISFFVDDKKMLAQNLECSLAYQWILLSFGNPWWYEPSHSIIDEIKMFNYEKSLEEIKQDYYNYFPEQIKCYQDSNCGTNSWIGTPACQNGNVYQYFKKYTCNNPGTTSAYCTSKTIAQLKQTCTYGCANGVCNAAHLEKGKFARGMNYVSWWYNQYDSTTSDASLQAMKENTNSDWVSILVTQYLDDLSDTSIAPISTKTPTDAGITRAIKKAHALGMKVSLKPHVDVGYYSSIWRGNISYSNETDWQNWFSSYKAFINHYAELAEANDVEMLVVGTELKGTSHRESDWRSIIGGVKARYSGKIVYGANHDEYQGIAWWDALDYVGVDAYFSLTSELNPTMQEMQSAFAQHIAGVESLAAGFGKKIMITEIGFQSRDGTNIIPWWSNGSLDLQEQADAYAATLEVMKNSPNIAGAFWWNWLTWPTQGGATDVDFTPHGKPAETVLAQYYMGTFAFDSIACYSNSDCGTNAWSGSPFCQSGNVYQNYITYICNNPGTPSSSCSNATAAKLKQTCTYGCTAGACIGGSQPGQPVLQCPADAIGQSYEFQWTKGSYTKFTLQIGYDPTFAKKTFLQISDKETPTPIAKKYKTLLKYKNKSSDGFLYARINAKDKILGNATSNTCQFKIDALQLP